jgi:UDP-glucuronate 4-epimerase
MKTLITGSAGFIGHALSTKLLDSGNPVVGIDNMNDYYDVNLKEARLKNLLQYPKFKFYSASLENKDDINDIFSSEKPEKVVNLAAQAGVRYSLINPQAYISSNIAGFTNILEACRHNKVKHLVYASSSSVYGATTTMPFSVSQNVDHPVSLYAATKKANELMAHTYSHLFRLPTTGLRFFTVYGPWGRPDMALFIFTKKILAGEPIDVFNFGKHRRDFTYIDDIVEGIIRVMNNVASPNPDWDSDRPDSASSSAPYRLYNIGSNNPTELLKYIELIEACLNKKAEKNLLPLQPGDVPDTFADVSDLVKDINYKPDTPIEIGIKNFVNWYRHFYKV